VGEGQGDNNAGGAAERITIAEAATLLGCHPNTVRSRVKAGLYRAEKVLTENGPTWMIDRNSLTNNAPTSASQQGVSGVPALRQEDLQELARQIAKEAGLSQDPEKEAAEQRRRAFIEGGREHWKAQVDFFKHMATISGASIAFVIGVSASFINKPDNPLFDLRTAASGLLSSVPSLTMWRSSVCFWHRLRR
jgi:hypothetical protein